MWDEEAFADLLGAVRKEFAAAAVSSARVVGAVLASAGRVEATLAGMLTAAHDESVLDIRAHRVRQQSVPAQVLPHDVGPDQQRRVGPQHGR